MTQELPSLEPIRVELSKLELQPGDKLVVKVDQKLRREQRVSILRYVSQWCPGVRVLVLDGGMELSVVRSDAAEPLSGVMYADMNRYKGQHLDIPDDATDEQRQAIIERARKIREAGHHAPTETEDEELDTVPKVFDEMMYVPPLPVEAVDTVWPPLGAPHPLQEHFNKYGEKAIEKMDRKMEAPAPTCSPESKCGKRDCTYCADKLL